jgi:CubicO group peptidase (beta-lactamase class C family)
MILTTRTRRPIGPGLASLGVLILALNGAPGHAQVSNVTARIQDRMQPFADQKQVSGCVALVGRGDRIVSIVALGRRNVEDDLPMQPDTLFRIASMTKPITAIGIMTLVDDGKLAVDDAVEKFLPEFRGQMMVTDRSEDTITLKKPPRPITVRDLLTHTSGLPGAPPPGLSGRTTGQTHSLAEAVMAFSQRPLDFEPGTRWAYCNTGIDSLGRIIEVVSGKSYASFLKDRIFDPLGMADTTFEPSPAQMQRAAVVYNRKDGELRPDPAFTTGAPSRAYFPSPAGGLFSTANDLAKLYQMMLNRGTAGSRRLLSESSVAEMTRVHTGDLKAGFTDGIGFGLGWSVVRRPTGETAMLSPGTYGHGGAYGTQCWIDPHKGLFTILMIQRSDQNPREEAAVRRELPQIAFEE